MTRGFYYCIDTSQKSLLADDVPVLREMLGPLAMRQVTSDVSPIGKPSLIVHSALIDFDAREAKDRFAWKDWGFDTMASGSFPVSIKIGCDPQALPSPRDLARNDQTHGQVVRLADDRDWMVPTVYTRTGKCLLMPSLTLSLDGAIQEVNSARSGLMADRFERLFELVRDIHEQNSQLGRYGGDEAAAMTELVAGVIDALSVNYRVGRAEVGLLGLLNPANLLGAAAAVVNYDLYIALLGEKKNMLETIWYQRALSIMAEQSEPSESGEAV